MIIKSEDCEFIIDPSEYTANRLFFHMRVIGGSMYTKLTIEQAQQIKDRIDQVLSNMKQEEPA